MCILARAKEPMFVAPSIAELFVAFDEKRRARTVSKSMFLFPQQESCFLGCLPRESLMLHTTDHIPPHFRPINRRIQFLIQQAAYSHILPSHQVQSMRHFFAVFRVVLWANDALDGVLKHEIGDLIAREEGAGQGSTVCSQDEDFFCGSGEGVDVSELYFRRKLEGTLRESYYRHMAGETCLSLDRSPPIGSIFLCLFG